MELLTGVIMIIMWIILVAVAILAVSAILRVLRRDQLERLNAAVPPYEDPPPEENFWDDRTTPNRNG